MINLSLGGPEPSLTAEILYAKLRGQNKLAFAACGNDGTTEFFYPASYNEVRQIISFFIFLNLLMSTSFLYRFCLANHSRFGKSTSPQVISVGAVDESNQRASKFQTTIV